MRKAYRLAFLLIVLSSISSIAHAQSFATPSDRLKAIAPLVETRVAGGDLKAAFSKRAAAAKVEEKRLDLWLNLFLSHGREGLLTLAPASAIEMARQMEGTWKMGNRFVGNKMSNVQTRQYNQVVETREGFARVRSLTFEKGVLDTPLRVQKGGPQPRFTLISYGDITHQVVQGEKYGLGPGETAVLQVYDGEIRGINYPGVPNDKPVAVKLETLWVRQGNTYRTAYMAPRYEGVQTANLAGPEDHFIAAVDTQVTRSGDQFFLGYSNQDSSEFFQRISTKVAVGDIQKFYQQAMKNPRLLDPATQLPKD